MYRFPAWQPGPPRGIELPLPVRVKKVEGGESRSSALCAISTVGLKGFLVPTSADKGSKFRSLAPQGRTRQLEESSSPVLERSFETKRSTGSFPVSLLDDYGGYHQRALCQNCSIYVILRFCKSGIRGQAHVGVWC
ncbi:hypothetical protein GOP47_0008410 [Adiantum capillus-veneris]|uniref:Uncharacterized protein n=1 Tax=Adiantum capillus-veneris TaxID=13818 RepID=A0A9D4ZKN9_ADICA|nr:hypothetical protein GOP47_0008410 [Adiantum capillus-veneris]